DVGADVGVVDFGLLPAYLKITGNFPAKDGVQLGGKLRPPRLAIGGIIVTTDRVSRGVCPMSYRKSLISLSLLALLALPALAQDQTSQTPNAQPQASKDQTAQPQSTQPSSGSTAGSTTSSSP